MIKLVDRLPDNISADCAASVRAISLFNAYHGYDIALFWAQFDQTGRAVAFISRMDGDMTVSTEKSADTDELAQFIRAVGARSVMSDRPLPLDGGTAVTQLSAVGTLHSEQNSSLADTYSIMSTCFDMPDFDAWYADMSHRVRHGAAAVRCSDSAAACALIADDAALIVGLSTRPDNRGKGNATAVLDRIKAIGCKRLYVLAEEQMVNYYVNRSFEICGRHYLYNGDV